MISRTHKCDVCGADRIEHTVGYSAKAEEFSIDSHRPFGADDGRKVFKHACSIECVATLLRELLERFDPADETVRKGAYR